MLNRTIRTLFMLIALTAVTGCAGSLSLEPSDFGDYQVPRRHQISNIPLIQQQQYFCGPAALTAILRHQHQDASQTILAEEVFNTQEEGTFQYDMLYALRSRGLLATPVNNLQDVITEVSKDNPVLVFLNLGLSFAPKWHYAVATGYDLDADLIYLHGGRNVQDIMPFSTFGHTWRRTNYWAYVVTTPPRLPVTADAHTLDDIVPRFEDLGQLDAAKKTYMALIQRSPERSQPYFGLGNVYLNQQQYAQAETAYRHGLKLEPNNPYIANNLAYALSGQGEMAEACALLQTTTSADDTVNAMLQDSRAEICGNAPSAPAPTLQPQ
jgi:tetratricopeptide (TPR) repeat protein